MPQYVSFSSTLLGPTCLIQHGVASMGYDLSDPSDPRQPDWQACQSFCVANYPNSKLFVYITTNDSNTASRKQCRCKSEFGNVIQNPARITGEIACTTMTSTTTTTTTTTSHIAALCQPTNTTSVNRCGGWVPTGHAGVEQVTCGSRCQL